MPALFQRFCLGRAIMPNRIVMSPMTRSRSTQPGDVPNAMMAEYYAQRASAGLIISEATQISPQGKGYSFTPGIYSREQIDGWKLVTKAVHEAGGRMFLQLWHVGRMSHASFQADGQTVAPSALSPDAQVWVADPQTGTGTMVDCPVPRALSTAEVGAVVRDFARAAGNAMEAGFDGVEIHGANGYLIDQFLRRSSNHRTDQYGGSIENRVRFLDEVTTAVAAEAGAERTGIRLAPYITARNMADDEIIRAILLAARRLDEIGIAYIHLSEADWDDAPVVPSSFHRDLRNTFRSAIIVAGKYDKQRACKMVGDGLADLVAFGRPFVANPDLPRRFKDDLPLAEFDPASLFGGDSHGYTDYPAYAGTVAAA
ncbi:MAG: alkene reductase [Hyphomicrobiaceae bacterium]|nr:alkene reductase [Hyphomicrobiaceae bacterium]